MLPVYVLTNDKHLWLLRGFAHLWGKFAPPDCPVIICGYSPPPFALPANFAFVSLGRANRPAAQWSDGLIQMCQDVISYTHFIFMLEDYWLTSTFDPRLIEATWRICWKGGDDILTVDLSGTRQASTRAHAIYPYAGGEIVETPPGTPYQMSFQAAIWNKARLLEMLRPNETPWQSEIQGSERVSAARLRALGTRPALMHYKPVYRTRSSTLKLDGIQDAGLFVRNGWTGPS